MDDVQNITNLHVIPFGDMCGVAVNEVKKFVKLIHFVVYNYSGLLRFSINIFHLIHGRENSVMVCVFYEKHQIVKSS